MTALVVGGGIGGLTAALCLAKQGVKVTIFEQTPALESVGAGIQLSPNCSRVLHYLGLEQSLAQVACLPLGTQFRHWRTGQVIAQNELGVAASQRYGAPYYHIHRGDLLTLLCQAVQESDNIDLHFAARIDAFQQIREAVELKVDEAAYTADLLIGADGIHSLIRRELWGEEQATFTGNVAWRALVPTQRLPIGLLPKMSTVWWGPGKHFVHYYVRGGEFVNCVCVVEKPGWEVESWTEAGELEELQRDFAGWHDDIQAIIEQTDTESLFKWALFDRKPMSRWGQGRVTLLGDACHPTLPFMAQGAAMAIEDAAVLAASLTSGSDVVEALQTYENLRHERTAGIQRGSRRNAKIFHLAGIQAWARDRMAQRAGGRSMDELYKYDALSVVK